MKSIDSRLPVDSNVAPIKISDEDIGLVSSIKDLTIELNEYRSEVGRLYQLLNNMVTMANNIESKLNTSRDELVSKYAPQTDGRWAIDFESNELVKITERVPTPA
jgi:hypothetical protein